jgi:F-type H+-transporting ATPase subunit gamma
MCRIVAYYEAEKEKLYPLDFSFFEKQWKGRTIPQHKSSQKDLLSSLIHYYLYAKIYKAFIESLTTENSHRLIAMDHAEQNIKEIRESLEKKILHKRQEEITSELLDIVTGYLSLS